MGVATNVKFSPDVTTLTVKVGEGVLFTLQALDSEESIDESYSRSMSVSVVSGDGTLSGTLSKSSTEGVAALSAVYPTSPGTLTIKGTSSGLTDSPNLVMTVEGVSRGDMTHDIASSNPNLSFTQGFASIHNSIFE